MKVSALRKRWHPGSGDNLFSYPQERPSLRISIRVTSAMMITVVDLQKDPLEFDLAYEPGSIEYGFGIRQLDPLAVDGHADLIVEHRGPNETIDDIRLRASYKGRFEALCARCLDPVEYPLEEHFDLLFRPTGADGDASEHSITTSETEIGYYQRDGVLLEDVLREQVLLSLPARSLCREDCKGLCPHCGKHLNSETCACTETVTDPRWSALSSLRTRVRH
jgi:uncharacterized protein